MSKVADSKVGLVPDEVPVSLYEAARVLRERYPQWAFTRSQLRQMCFNRVLPYMEVPQAGTRRRVLVVVRVAELVKRFEQMEVKPLWS